jgi:serine/threonine-protein kinase
MQLRELAERYKLQKILKSTRFGTVLQATDLVSGRTVAVKLVTTGSSPGFAMVPELERLAATLAELRHPNLPAALDSGFTTDGSAFLVLELLEGKGFDTLAGGPPAHLLSLIDQALEGLEALAGHGLSHHNVSPDNLLVVHDGRGERVVLLGLATALFRPRGAGAVAPENARFLAPELADSAPADGRADLYSLALTACHALGANVSFAEPPVVQMPLAVSFALENDEALRQALESSLRPNPGQRPAARDFREALRLAIGEPTGTPLMIPDAWIPGASEPSLSAPLPSPDPQPLPAPQPLKEAAEEEPGDVLSEVNDEILNALLSVPPPPPRPASFTPAGKGKPAAAAVAAPAPARQPSESAVLPFYRRPAILGAAAALVVLCVLAAVWILRRPQAPPPAPPAPRAALPQVPTQPPLARLEEAKLYLAAGEDLHARRVLRSIHFGEQGLLSPQQCRELAAIEQTLALAALERLPADLASGLKTGNLEVLQAAVEAGAGQEAAPEVRADLDRARGIIEAYSQARTAAGRGDHVQVLDRFAALMALLPGASDPENLRGKAAEALETQAAALVRDARYPEALARLAPLQRTWPDRTGLTERVSHYETYQRDEKPQEAVLDALPGFERRRKPADGLEAIRDLAPTPHLAPRFAAARQRLEALLAQLDREPPQIVLRDGYLLEYSRGTVAELSFRATDDYQVKDVKLLARPQGGKFRSLPLETTRSGYSTVKIDPGFHRNGMVELYLVATDLSGHEGHYGTADKPLQLKRKQGFERLIQ